MPIERVAVVHGQLGAWRWVGSDGGCGQAATAAAGGCGRAIAVACWAGGVNVFESTKR
jgi:hypothetical protein